MCFRANFHKNRRANSGFAASPAVASISVLLCSYIVLCICGFPPGNEEDLFCFKYSSPRQLKDDCVM